MNAGVEAGLSPRQGRAEFRFERRDGERTHLARHYAAYPFHVTRPLYFDAGWPELPTLLLQSASGGLFQGDRLNLEVSIGQGAAAQITTQSATKVHSMERGHARQATRLVVEAGGHLELIADATILFPDSHVETATTLSLAQGASAIIADSLLWHDPKAGGAPNFALMAAAVEARDDRERLLVLDRYRIARPAADAATRAFWSDYKAQGALYAFAPSSDIAALIESLRGALEGIDQCYAAVSALPNDAGAYVRALAPEGNVIRTVQECAWRAARSVITGRGAQVSWRK